MFILNSLHSTLEVTGEIRVHQGIFWVALWGSGDLGFQLLSDMRGWEWA